MWNLQMQKLNEQEHEKNFSDKNYDLGVIRKMLDRHWIMWSLWGWIYFDVANM